MPYPAAPIAAAPATQGAAATAIPPRLDNSPPTPLAAAVTAVPVPAAPLATLDKAVVAVPAAGAIFDKELPTLPIIPACDASEAPSFPNNGTPFLIVNLCQKELA